MVGSSMNLDDVGLSALWAADAEYLARIADSLGKPEDARRFRRTAGGVTLVTQRMLSHMEP